MKTLCSIIILISFNQLSCSNQNTNQDLSSVESETNKEILTKEKSGIDNKYTKIATLNCEEFGEHEFTKDNTEYFDINSRETEKHTFVFASALSCKFSGGTCGYNIEVFQETENDKYQVVYENCARELERLNQTKNGYYLFTITLRDGQEYIISYNGKKFEDYYSSFRGIPIKHAKIIAKELDVSLEYFFSRPAENYRYKKLEIGKAKTVDFYKTKLGMNNYFMFENDKLIFKEEDLIEFELMKSNKEYFDIKVLKNENLVMTKDTSYYEPKFFTYSLIEQMYKAQ